VLYVTFRHVLPAAVAQPALLVTQAQASERQGNLRPGNVMWNDEQPLRAGTRVKVIGGSIEKIIGRVGLVLKTGTLTQGKWNNEIVHQLQLEDTWDGKAVNVITLQRFTSVIDGTQPSLASPAAGAPAVVIPKRATRSSLGTTASPSAAALDQTSFAAALGNLGARCGYICHIPSRNRN
jgi:hypothetical protein